MHGPRHHTNTAVFSAGPIAWSESLDVECSALRDVHNAQFLEEACVV
jgi:hypothetical protein